MHEVAFRGVVVHRTCSREECRRGWRGDNLFREDLNSNVLSKNFKSSLLLSETNENRCISMQKREDQKTMNDHELNRL